MCFAFGFDFAIVLVLIMSSVLRYCSGFELDDDVGFDSVCVCFGVEYELGFEFEDVAIECSVGFVCVVNSGFGVGAEFGLNVGFGCDVGVDVCFGVEFDVDVGFEFAFALGVEYKAGFETGAVAFD